MEVGTKVYCKDVEGEYIGYISSIEYNLHHPISVVKHKKDIGKTFTELCVKYGHYTNNFEVFDLEDLTEYDSHRGDKKMTQVKIFTVTYDNDEEKLNKFIKDKEVIDIKMSAYEDMHSNTTTKYILVIYKDIYND